MEEFYCQVGSEVYYLRHSLLNPKQKTLLFLHGLGDSSLNYTDFFNDSCLQEVNLIMPDLLGYGKSSGAVSYCFNHQVKAIIHQVQALQKHFQISFNDIYIVSHSLGGIHAIKLSESIFQSAIKGLVMVEGSITPFGSFVSKDAVEANAANNFDKWFLQFKEDVVYKRAGSLYPWFRRYYASLQFCNPAAFLQNATEIRELCLALPQRFSHVMGQKYHELKIPRVYCYGKSMCEETIEFLNLHSLQSRYFPAKTHFLMQECHSDFVDFLSNWFRNIASD